MLGMVAAVVVVNDVNHWWVLLPAMFLALVATVSVLGVTMSMLDGDE
jgi:high-affinity K+ transport system ATPase subunit B